MLDQFKGNQPPLKKYLKIRGGGVDRCSTPLSKIQGGGLRPPNPPPLFCAPGCTISFFHDGLELSELKAIANTFNVYFANIGKNLAATIEQDNNAVFNHMQYLSTPTKTSFNFHCITERETMKAIDTLENKSSSGHDGISNKIVKLLINKISKPLTVIINQMLKTGIIPDFFKTSKLVPLFKKGDY